MPETKKSELGTILRFVAGLWLRDLDDSIQSQLRGPLSESWQSLGGVLPDSSIEELQADYCRLFANPQSYVAPFQSVWTTGQLDGLPAVSMRRYLKETGYLEEHGANRHEVPDHLGLQLDLAGWMWGHAEIDELINEVATRFSIEHLRWPKAMLDRVEGEAETQFYCGLAIVTRSCLEFVVAE